MTAYHTIVATCRNLAVAAYHEHCFLLKRHSLQDFIHIVALQFHLCCQHADAPQKDGTDS